MCDFESELARLKKKFAKPGNLKIVTSLNR